MGARILNKSQPAASAASAGAAGAAGAAGGLEAEGTEEGGVIDHRPNTCIGGAIETEDICGWLERFVAL